MKSPTLLSRCGLVELFNHNHDAKGLFSSADMGGSFGGGSESTVKKVVKDLVGAQPTLQKRAKKGGEIAPNDEHYKGGAFIATTELPKKIKRDLEHKATGGVIVELFQKNQVPPPGKMSILEKGAGTIYNIENRYSPKPTLSLNHPYLEYMGYPADKKAVYQDFVDRYNRGERFVDVSAYPQVANIVDAARMHVAGMPVPEELLAKLGEVGERLRKYQTAKLKT